MKSLRTAMAMDLRRMELLDLLTAEAEAEEDQEVELSLGLSIGGSSRKKVTSAGHILNGSYSVTVPGGGPVDPQRRREADAFRWQCRARDREAREEEADPRSSGTKAGEIRSRIPESTFNPNPEPNPCPSLVPNPNPNPNPNSIPMVPMYMPISNGFGFPYMVPCWAPTVSSDTVGNAFHPVACQSFPPFRNPNPKHISNANHNPNPSVVCHPEKIGGKSIGLMGASSISDFSSVSSSSGISDYQCSSLRGRSSSSGELRSHSSPAVAEKPKEQATEEAVSNPSFHTATPAKLTGSADKVDQMPGVSTTGPDERTINGLLYRYTKSEVSVVCVCHGSTFSPAGFVRHAGGTEGSHPLRQIMVVPP